MSSPWMASEYSSYREIESFENSVFAECFQGILRACGSEPACCRSKRGDADLIETDEHDKRKDRHLADTFKNFFGFHVR